MPYLVKITILMGFIFMPIFLVATAQDDSLRQVINQSKSDSSLAITYLRLGQRYGSADSGYMYYEKALFVAKRENLTNVLGEIYSTLGVHKFKENKIDSGYYYYNLSEQYLLAALKKYDLISIQSQLANVQYNIALYYYYKGDYNKVIAYAQLALDIYLVLDMDKKISACYNILGFIYMAEDEFIEAYDIFSKAVDIAILLKDTARISMMYNNLALSLKELGKYDEALIYFNKSLEINPNASDVEKLGTEISIGNVYMYIGQYQKARAILLNCVKGFEEYGDTRSKIISLNLLGDLYIKTEEWTPLLAVSLKSLELLKDLPILNQKKFASHNLSVAYEHVGKPVDALSYYKEYTLLKDSILNEEKTKELDRLEAKFEFEKNEKEIGKLTEENLKKEVQIAEEQNFRFILMGVVLGVGLLSLIIFLYYKRKQESRQHQLAMTKMEIEQRMIRSQMNPHFIFNALNSIQSYISTNKTYEAEVFLSKFSLLIRNILENSMHQNIDLDTEIETLNLYLTLEKLRFDDKFDFSINDDVMDGTIKIPPMLMQPFVENAILHGMKGKASKGHISVRFSETDDEILLCEVEDDGVGRHQKNDQPTDHVSLATQLTNDRIQFFKQSKNKNDRMNYDMKITDLKNSQGEASGTLVQIWIPIDLND